MKTLKGYRYLLAVRPGSQWLSVFRQVAEAFGQPVGLDPWHLTLCAIGESLERDRFIVPRVQRALDGQTLHSFPVNLSRVRAGPHGAYARTFGRQAEIQDFYRTVILFLLACGIEPRHRKAGFHPHVTIGYRACTAALVRIALSWFPSELLLIESEVGLTKHNVLAQWPLLPPYQPPLPLVGFTPPLFPDGWPTAAADPVRRSAA